MALHQRKWSKVALLVPGRSDVQVGCWGKGLAQAHTNAQRHAALRFLGEYSASWLALSPRLPVPAAPAAQCRERFMNVLNPEVKAHDPWTEEEDAALEEAVAEHTSQVPLLSPSLCLLHLLFLELYPHWAFPLL